MDCFIEPADAVIEKRQARGIDFAEDDNGYTSIAPTVGVALWRDGDPYDDARQLPVYFESILVARDSYYD